MSVGDSPIARNGHWMPSGLTTSAMSSRSRGPSPAKQSAQTNGDEPMQNVTWSSAKAKSARVNEPTIYQKPDHGFLGGHLRRMSSGLPYFSSARNVKEDTYGEKEKLGRGRHVSGRIDWDDLGWRIRAGMTKRRQLVAAAILLVLLLLWFGSKPFTHWYRRTSWLGGGSKFVIILAANEGGGVMDWKGAREWAIERDSVRNKKRYAARWGYELEIVDMSTKKRYAHEWRESWEKVDIIRNTMGKYSSAEWFWWLDLNTFVMEPSYSLQSHIFNNLERNTYRDINIHNPLKIAHPPNDTSATQSSYLDERTLSPTGDGDPSSIDLIIPQDCSGFNLGSFFARRSAWTDRMLDIWWDPVFYEQRHMDWEHKEQDALEHIYTNQPGVRSHIAFIPQRKINAFPDGACGDDAGMPQEGCRAAERSLQVATQKVKELASTSLETQEDIEALRKDVQHWSDAVKECGVPGIHYQESERDFLVNMAGCEWGRDCWGEIYNFRELSNHLNRTWWERFKDFFTGNERRWRKELQRKRKEDKERKERERAEQNK